MIKGCMVGDQTVVTSKVHRAIVSSAVVWFTATPNFLSILHHVSLIYFRAKPCHEYGFDFGCHTFFGSHGLPKVRRGKFLNQTCSEARINWLQL
jgi:hypothetical protein